MADAKKMVKITPGVRGGRVVIPPSKSIAHRALICAALAPMGQVSHLSHLPYNDDIDATLDCLRALGVTIDERRTGDVREVIVSGCGGDFSASNAPLGCRESGSTLRFLLPLCLLSSASRVLTGSSRLLQRPLNDYDGLFADRPLRVDATAGVLSLAAGQTLQGQTLFLSGKSSSQFITGLLYVLPLLEKDSELVLSAPPESRSYIDMTLAVLARFGVHAAWRDATHLSIPGGQVFCPCDMAVDGDASGAAFFHALSFLAQPAVPILVDCAGSADIVQGDAVCPACLERLKAEMDDFLPVISLADCPDLGPVLFATSAARRGAIFTHTARLRLKESDRISAMASELEAFGVSVAVSDGEQYGASDAYQTACAIVQAADIGTDDWVVVFPPENGLQLPKRVLHGHNDHRIVMSLSVLAAVGEGDSPVLIDDAQAVSKSFPEFFDCLRSLGVHVETVTERE